MAAKQFGESKGRTWTLFVLATAGIGIGGIMAIIDLNGTANKTPIIVGAVVLGLLILGFFLLTVRAILEHSKAPDGT